MQAYLAKFRKKKNYKQIMESKENPQCAQCHLFKQPKPKSLQILSSYRKQFLFISKQNDWRKLLAGTMPGV